MFRTQGLLHAAYTGDAQCPLKRTHGIQAGFNIRVIVGLSPMQSSRVVRRLRLIILLAIKPVVSEGKVQFGGICIYRRMNGRMVVFKRLILGSSRGTDGQPGGSTF